MSRVTDIKTFVDEAGLNGLVRNLRPEQDNDISLLCALPIPIEYEEYCRSEVRAFYDIFREAAPSGATLHVTDAFAPGHESWRTAAETARQGIFKLIQRHRMYVVYAARRARIARESFEQGASHQASAVADIKASHFRVPGLERPSRDNILGRVMTTLSLRLNEFLKSANKQRTDFYCDTIDDALADEYRRRINEIRNVLDSSSSLKRRNVDTGENEIHTLNIRIDADREIDTSRIGDVIVADKSDPLIFAIDIISNSLLRHLRALPHDKPLNLASSVTGWILDENTFIDRRPNAALSPLDMV